MKIGNLRKRVEIQSEQRVDDGQGGYALSWIAVMTAWAEITPISGKEKLEANKPQSTTTYKITLRRRDDITIAPAMRAVCEESAFNIRAVLNDEPRWTTLMVEEGGAT